MKKLKLTPWFHPVEVPERIGVYERIRWKHDEPFYSYWDGRKWWPSGVTPEGALQQYASYISYGVPRWVSQILHWRGVIP